MKKYFNLLIIIILLFFGQTAGQAATIDLGRLFGAASDLVTAGSGVSETEEIELGREIAGRTMGAAPLVNDAVLQAYVNRVGRWLALQTERPDLPWHFGVLDTSSVNAFAAPGGYVLITRGLYEILDNESQLAGVLAHEIGHIIKRHHVTVMQKSAAISAGAKLAQSGDRSYFLNNMIGSGAEIFARGLDKSAEFEADAVGVVIAARAGYSPYGLIEVLHKLGARGDDDAELALLFKTHPQPGERLTQLGEALTPRMAGLPAGKEPGIKTISAEAGPAQGAMPAPSGAKALQEEPAAQPAQKEEGAGADPGQFLRGLIGR